MNQTSAQLAREVSELEGLGITTIASNNVKVPAIKEAKIRFEAEVYQHIPIYNHEQTKILSDLFILSISDFYFAESVLDQRKGYIDVMSLNPVARLAGPNYGSLGSTYQLKRP